MSKNYDVIVVGVGGMGSSICYHLAKRGVKTLGIEQYGISHTYGSSFGDSRIFRLSQFAGAEYVPLAIRAKDLWAELEDYSNEKVLTTTGGLDAGPDDGPIFSGALKSSQESGLDHEVLDANELKRRFPAFNLPSHYKGIYQKDAGIIVPERAVVAHTRAAMQHGATITTYATVKKIEPNVNSVKVTTDKGCYEAEKLVMSGGPWTGEILPELKQILTPERGCVGWFTGDKPEYFQVGTMPICIIDDETGSFYGFPEFGARLGFKIGTNIHLKEYGKNDELRRGFDQTDEERLRHYTKKYMNKGNGVLTTASDCVWTLTPDEHFILDVHPNYPNISIAAGFSGYGFKFCPVIGEIMADIALGKQPSFDLNLHKLSRFN